MRKHFHSENGLGFNPAVNPADFGEHIFKNIQKRINNLIFRYCEAEKKCPTLLFSYLKKLQELAQDIYGGCHETS